MSNHRKKLIRWLNNFSAKGSTLDIGGDRWDTRSSLKSMEGEYDTLQEGNFDLNYPANAETGLRYGRTYDNIFFNEVLQFIWNPSQALLNVKNMLSAEGTLYVTFHRYQPDMKGHDYMRLTRKGVCKLLAISGLDPIDIQEPIEGYYLVTCKHSQ